MKSITKKHDCGSCHLSLEHARCPDVFRKLRTNSKFGCGQTDVLFLTKFFYHLFWSGFKFTLFSFFVFCAIFRAQFQLSQQISRIRQVSILLDGLSKTETKVFEEEQPCASNEADPMWSSESSVCHPGNQRFKSQISRSLWWEIGALSCPARHHTRPSEILYGSMPLPILLSGL